MQLHLRLALALACLLLAAGWRTFPRLTELQRQQASWCAQVAEPPWPLAYTKLPSSALALAYWRW
jgi:hypothetical protein